MVAEERSVNHILNELLGGPGCGIEVQSSKRYIHPREHLSFMQLSKRVQEHDEILLGYQHTPVLSKEDTVINPRDKMEVKAWDGMGLIVIRGDCLHPKLHIGEDKDGRAGKALASAASNSAKLEAAERQRKRHERAMEVRRQRRGSTQIDGPR